MPAFDDIVNDIVIDEVLQDAGVETEGRGRNLSQIFHF